MSLKFNRVQLAATLTADPEIRTTNSGKMMANMRLADSDNKKDPTTGQWERTNQLFIDAKCFEKTAETAQKFGAKGKRFLFEGRIAMETWQDKNTQQDRSKLVLIVDRINFCEDAKAGEGAGDSGSGNALPPRQTQARSGGTAQPKASGYQEAPMPGEGGANGDMPF